MIHTSVVAVVAEERSDLMVGYLDNVVVAYTSLYGTHCLSSRTHKIVIATYLVLQVPVFFTKVWRPYPDKGPYLPNTYRGTNRLFDNCVDEEICGS